MNYRQISVATVVILGLVLATLTACSNNSTTITTTGTTSAATASSATTTTGTATTSPSPSGASTTGASSPGGGAVINSDSIITGKINAVRPQTSGYPWEVDVLILSSANVSDLPNPTSDKVGQVITVKTDQGMSSFSSNQTISARIKYIGDVPKPGITLYMYDITEITVATTCPTCL